MRSSKPIPLDKASKLKIKSLAPLTIGFGLYIIISASFMQQVWKFLSKVWGENNLRMFCILVYLVLSVIILLYIIKSHFHILRLMGNIIILTSGFLFAWQQPYFVEKMHVLEYGILGWMAMNDIGKDPKSNTVKSISFAFIFSLVVSILDEGFQKVLPYRVGEIRDAVTNVIGALFGIGLFLTK